MKKYILSLMPILAFILSSCSLTALDSPKKYDIFVTGAGEERVLDYVKYMTKQKHYEAHKLLSLNNIYSEVSYTSYLAPEVVYSKTSEFFGGGYKIKLNSNVINVEKVN